MAEETLIAFSLIYDMRYSKQMKAARATHQRSTQCD